MAYRSSWFGRRPWMELQPQAGRFVLVDDSHAVDKPRSAGMRGARADELAERPDRHRLSPGMKSLCCPLQELFGELGLIAHASTMFNVQQSTRPRHVRSLCTLHKRSAYLNPSTLMTMTHV